MLRKYSIGSVRSGRVNQRQFMFVISCLHGEALRAYSREGDVKTSVLLYYSLHSMVSSYLLNNDDLFEAEATRPVDYLSPCILKV